MRSFLFLTIYFAILFTLRTNLECVKNSNYKEDVVWRAGLGGIQPRIPFTDDYFTTQITSGGDWLSLSADGMNPAGGYDRHSKYYDIHARREGPQQGLEMMITRFATIS